MRSLFTKVFLAHLVTLLVALVTVSLLLSTALHRLLSPLYMQLAARELLGAAQHIAIRLDPLIGAPGREEELRELTRLLEAGTHTEICLVPKGKQATGPLAGRVPAGKTDVAPARVFPCEQDMLVAHISLPRGEGSLFVRASVAGAVRETIRRVRGLVIYAGLVAVALALLVALGLSERISGPLRRMRRLAGEMAAGDFTQRLQMKGSDEVGALARSFDSLADSLQKTLDQLRQEQAHLRGILASVAEGIIAVDTEGRITLINPQAAALLGADQEHALGSTISELGLPEEVSRQFTECLRSSQLCRAEFQLPNPQRHLVLQAAPVRAAESGRWGAVAVVRDITESRRLEEMRRQFISDASHEIRTPLTAIGGFAAAIADGVAAGPEEGKRCASLIVREVERLNRLVGDLLDLSRIESGAVSLKFEEVDLPELVGSALEALEAQTREKEIRIELSLPRDLPPVRGDADRIYQVLVNLVSNALRFNRPRGRISIAARQIAGQVRVEVRDTGPGIPAPQLPHIWERFHRADASRARQEGGTGLGLAIVRSIVEAHGGSVSAESVVGEGSTFSFTLPIT